MSKVEDDGYSETVIIMIMFMIMLMNQVINYPNHSCTQLRGLSHIFKQIFSQFSHQRPGRLILVRHGETNLNLNRTFTGWIDTDLSPQGIKEIEHAAHLLLERGYQVDVTYTSRLKRAIRSAWILNSALNQVYKPVYKSWRLNERMVLKEFFFENLTIQSNLI